MGQTDSGAAGHRAAGLAVMLALALLSAACSGGGGGVSTAGSTSTSADTQAVAFRAYSACMKRNGVTLPAEAGRRRAGSADDGGEGGAEQSGQGQSGPEQSGPEQSGPEQSDAPGAGHQGGESPPSGVDQATFDRAQQACRSTLPAHNGAGERGDSADAAYRSCLRDNGVNVPTTVAGRRGPPPTVNPSDPALPAASAKCAPLLPNQREGATTTTTTTITTTTSAA